MELKYKKVKIWICRCKRCGWTWGARRNPKEIIGCAKCKSPYWKIPRTEGLKPRKGVKE